MAVMAIRYLGLASISQIPYHPGQYHPYLDRGAPVADTSMIGPMPHVSKIRRVVS
jgi:hypothetical protein